MSTESNLALRRAVRLALLSAGATAALHPSSAAAQTASASGESTGELQEVVVTGSRIASPSLEAISPVTAVTGEEVKQSGVTRIEDLLNSLPQVVADQGSGLSMGSQGTATVNLRGLGSQRTLVLVNGRRLSGGDPVEPSNTNLGYASAADINQIPVALIERVDVLTGGASSTYGADAVAGVVNFVMNDHFEGVRVDANLGIYNHSNKEQFVNPLLTARKFPTVSGGNWDGANKDLTVILGQNFADGAGNIEGYLGYRTEAPIQADHRDFSACVLQDAQAGGTPWICGGSSNSAPSVIQNVATGAYTQINPNGTLGPRYARFNYAASHYLQRLDQRYTAGFFAHLKLNDHVEAYEEFMFMDDDTRGNYAPAGAFFGSGVARDSDTGLPDGNWTVNCGTGGFGNAGMNPYLTQPEYTAWCAPGPYTNKTNKTGAPYQILPNGDSQLILSRRNVEGGPREDEYIHTTFRDVIGARGDIIEGFSYDLSATFSKTRSSNQHSNDVSVSRAQNTLLAVRDPTTGKIVCQGGQAGCVPWNIFNPAIAVDPAAIKYFSVPALFNGSQDQDVFSGYVSADLTKWGIKLPTADDGPKAVFGAEYRRETLDTHPDVEYLTADLSGAPSPIPAVSATMHVWEGFTELRVPLIRNLPFVKTLDFETGYRYSAYTTGFDTNTYKFGVEWAPTSDVRLRASYNRSVRTPNLQELYRPVGVALDGGGNDQCAAGTSLSAAQCALTGVTAAQYAKGITTSPAGQYNGLLGGNTRLKPEVGKTLNLGLVFTPSLLPGFSATIDYTDIKIGNIISSYGYNTIQTNCVLSNDPNSTWCLMIHRSAVGSLWSSPGGYIIDPTLNLGALENRSIDLGLAYTLDIGPLGKLHSRFDGTYLSKLLTTPGTGASYDCAGRFGPSCAPATPYWRHRLSGEWDTPVTGLSAGATWRFFGATSNSQLDPKTPDFSTAAIGVIDDHIPTVSYLDLRVSYKWNKLTVRAGCNNVLDHDPPLFDTVDAGGNSVLAESGSYPSLYDMAGRYLFLNVTADF